MERRGIVRIGAKDRDCRARDTADSGELLESRVASLVPDHAPRIQIPRGHNDKTKARMARLDRQNKFKGR